MADASKNNKKKNSKTKMTAMDYITIGFTAVIAVLMVFVVIRSINPDLFKKSSDDPSYTDSPSSTSVPQTTAEPSLTDIGNTYGNMSNNAHVAEIDGRTYFTAVDDGGISGIYVSAGGNISRLGETSAFSLNVIKDPFTYSDIPGATAYTVIYIDADGNIRAMTEGPFQNPSSSDTMTTDEPYSCTEPLEIADGDYKSIVAVGDYLYFIDGDGHIGKMSLTSDSYTVLSVDSYSSFCVYYGVIYAIHEPDGYIYELSTYSRPESDDSSDSEAHSDSGDEASAVPGVDEYEKIAVAANASSISVADDWLYVAGEDGISRYDITESYGKDTLYSSPVSFVNVPNNGEIITFVSDDKVYCAAAKDFLTGSVKEIGSASSITCLNTAGKTLSDLRIYIYSRDDHNLYAASYDSESGSFSAFEKVLK